MPLATFRDEEDATFTLCPRYAENDPTSAPPSPASIESFDMDSIPWRRSYIPLDGDTENSRLRMRFRRQKIRISVLLFLFALTVLGAGISAYLAVKHGRKSKS